MMRLLFAMLFAMPLLSAHAARAQDASPHAYVPPKGFVPDSMTAVRIAIAVWIPIYGATQIKAERPYVAGLRADVWTVTASLPIDTRGGVALVEISKQDGRILRVSHGR